MPKIYVIDDDKQLLRMLGIMLERGGYTPVLISDPKEGIEQIKQDKPDGLILDVMMPGMSGHDVCRVIRSTPEIADLPILILTARGQAVDRIAALESGADDYLSKPATSEELIIKLGDLISQKNYPQNEKESKGIIISCFGLRGGVGRTTLAVNLATALRRISQEKVTLLDFNLSGAQIALFLRIPPTKSWDMIKTEDLLSWSDWEEMILTHKSGVSVISAPPIASIIRPEHPGSVAIANSLFELKEHQRFTVVDLPPILTPESAEILKKSDIVLHLISPDVISVQIASYTQQTFKNASIRIKKHLYILNQPSPQLGLPPETIEKGLKHPISFQIGFDKNQSRALSQGVPLTLTSAQTPLPVIVRKIAKSIWKHT